MDLETMLSAPCEHLTDCNRRIRWYEGQYEEWRCVGFSRTARDGDGRNKQSVFPCVVSTNSASAKGVDKFPDYNHTPESDGGAMLEPVTRHPGIPGRVQSGLVKLF